MPDQEGTMADYVLFDEHHVTSHVLAGLDAVACDAIRRILESRQFRTALRRAIRRIVRHYPELARVRIRITV
jgi:hypothetical protein